MQYFVPGVLLDFKPPSPSPNKLVWYAQYPAVDVGLMCFCLAVCQITKDHCLFYYKTFMTRAPLACQMLVDQSVKQELSI